MADKTEKKQRGTGRQFEKGKSGNLNGRPKGTRNKTLFLLEQIIEKDAVDILNTVITMAKGGDLQAAKILIDRILPPKKDRPISLKLPKIVNSKDAMEATSIIIKAMSEGEITPLEGESFIKVIEIFIKSNESLELEERLKAIEERDR